MQVVNKSSYISTIYSAIVVNNDKDLDPDGQYRVQIYIPSINYNYADSYETYMNSTDKTSNDNLNLFKAFPWAVSLVSDLKNGDEVYGSYIDGDNTKFIVLGLNASAPSPITGVGGLENMSSLVNLALDIVLHNEIGVEIGAWSNDKIPDERFSTITLHDGGVYDKVLKVWIKQGCWAVGLIQWNGVRAYDTIYAIAEADGNWKSYFNHECDLKNAINVSLASRNTAGQRNNFSINKGWNPEKGGATYNAIKSLLSTDIGKKVQKQLAYNATYDVINMLVEKGCNNPAILIYMADFYNQYGSGYSQTTQKCVEACSQKGDILQQLNWLIDNQLKPNFSSFNTYNSRRKATYDYIVNLYNKGIFSDTTFNGNLVSISDYNEGGIFLFPAPDCRKITSPYGERIHPIKGTKSFHTGIDLSCTNAMGKKIIASHSGTVIFAKIGYNGGYGNLIKIQNGRYQTYYAHQQLFADNIKEGVEVKAGQVIGYVGSSGASTGAHLHFEVRIDGQHTNPLPYIKNS